VPRAGNKWDARIDRAHKLAADYPFSAQVLLFYSKVTTFQKISYDQLQSSCTFGNGRGTSLPSTLDEVDLALLIPRFGLFLPMIAREAPGPLAEFAGGLSTRGPDAWRHLLQAFWRGRRPLSPEADQHSSAQQDQGAVTHETGNLECFCGQAFLQPYAELLAERADVPAPEVRRPFCPYCGSPPLLGVMRQEGDGAKRSLVCSFCRTEWDHLRIACPACEERDEKKLCVYSTPAFDCVRVEACDTCRAYINTVDLTRNGLAVPEVDELAAIPLTLWADAHGYQKVARNILGL
jgi:hypothetical protein